MLRIILVWAIGLPTSIAFATRFESDAFPTVFITYGVFLTIPVLVLLVLAWLTERALMAWRLLPVAALVGPAYGIMIPAWIYFAAPSKKGVQADFTLFLTLGLVLGLLWMMFFFLHTLAAPTRPLPLDRNSTEDPDVKTPRF